MTSLCTRICPCPFFEATPPGAAPVPPVETAARVRRFRGCNKAEHDSKLSVQSVNFSLTLIRKKAIKKADTQARTTTNQTTKPKVANPHVSSN